jgi:hypothetical protein
MSINCLINFTTVNEESVSFTEEQFISYVAENGFGGMKIPSDNPLAKLIVNKLDFLRQPESVSEY